MRGVIVTGKMALIDAAVIRFLRDLKIQYGSVWAAPTAALLASAVNLSDLRYALNQLASIDGVSDSLDGLSREAFVTQFPVRPASQSPAAAHNPISDDEEVPPTCTVEELLRHRPEPLAVVSGCFDLIHAGHIRLIEVAAGYGAPPVVAMLTTRAIRRQPKNLRRRRPLWTMADRVTLVEELRSNPTPLLFDGPDCLELIAALRPDAWIKEMRDSERPIVRQEATLVERMGGRVIWVDNRGYGGSTTAIEDQMIALGWIERC
jgi:hypothetical protein